jgi:hypothetical protein
MQNNFGTAERWTWGLAALAIAVSSLCFGGTIALSVSVGSILSVFNAAMIRFVGARLLRAGRSPLVTILLFNVKMIALVGLIFLALKFLPIQPASFLVGFSILPVAIFCSAISSALATKPAIESEHG